MSITSQAPRNIQFDSKTTPEIVGPGSYEYRACISPAKRSRIPFGTTTKRDLWNLPDGEENLGPGSYEAVQYRSPTCLTNIQFESQRKYFVDNLQGPSPADHSNIQNWVKQRPKTGLTNRPKMRALSPPPPPPNPTLPGPGAYNLLSNEIDTRHVSSFSKSKVPQREPAKYNGVPGPAKYGDIDNYETIFASKPQSPAFKNREKRNVFTNPVNDGTMPNHIAWMPEIYEGRPFGSNLPRVLDWKSPGSDSPGPVVYSSQSKRPISKNNVGFGASRVEKVDTNPGPGFYDTDNETLGKQKNKLPTFRKARRQELWDINITPSPGQYENNLQDKIERCVVIRTASPAFKDRSSRYKFMVPEDPNPGPGGYFANKPEKVHYSKFNKDQRFPKDSYVGKEKINDSPSPANYTVETETTKKRTVGGQKVKAMRFDSGPKNTKVGPGRYGKVNCEMIRPSYNVKFDPELKKKSELKKAYS